MRQALRIGMFALMLCAICTILVTAARAEGNPLRCISIFEGATGYPKRHWQYDLNTQIRLEDRRRRHMPPIGAVTSPDGRHWLHTWYTEQGLYATHLSLDAGARTFLLDQSPYLPSEAQHHFSPESSRGIFIVHSTLPSELALVVFNTENQTIQRLQGGQSTRIGLVNPRAVMDWSADARYAALKVEKEVGGTIRQFIAIFDTDTLAFVGEPIPINPTLFLDYAGVLAWSPQGALLAVAADSPRRILIVSPDYGIVAQYPLKTEELTYTQLYWSPQSDHIAIYKREERLFFGFLWADGQFVRVEQSSIYPLGWSTDGARFGALDGELTNARWIAINTRTGRATSVNPERQYAGIDEVTNPTTTRRIFIAYDTFNRSGVLLADPDGSNLVEFAEGGFVSLAWSDRREFGLLGYYDARGDDWRGVLVNASGIILASYDAFKNWYSGAWDPLHMQFIFEAEQGGESVMGIIDPRTRQIYVVSHVSGMNLPFDYLLAAPKGTAIAQMYVGELFLSDGTMSKPISLWRGRSIQSAALLWHPNGRQLAYLFSTRSADFSLSVYELDGTPSYQMPVPFDGGTLHFGRWSNCD